MISILMPIFNGLQFLTDSVTSVINQSLKDWELLIGINGYFDAEDNLLSYQDAIHSLYLKQFQDNPKIKTFFYPFKGKTKTLNALVSEAKYDLICLLDVDDYWFPEKLKKQIKFSEVYDVVGSDISYFGEKLGTPSLFLGRLNPKMFAFQNPMVNSAAMLHKQNAIWNESWEGLDDYNLWISLLKKDKIFYNIPEILVNHRVHHASYYNNSNEEKRKNLLENQIEKLTEQDYVELGNIMDSKNWELY